MASVVYDRIGCRRLEGRGDFLDLAELRLVAFESGEARSIAVRRQPQIHAHHVSVRKIRLPKGHRLGGWVAARRVWANFHDTPQAKTSVAEQTIIDARVGMPVARVAILVGFEALSEAAQTRHALFRV